MTAVLFDLDGTLIDTAHDLGFALNALRAKHGLPALSYDTIRPVASHGSKGLLKLGFDIDENDAHFKSMVDDYLQLYAQSLTRKPVFLAGIEALLGGLESLNVPWGIVTNKPRRFALPLIQSVPFFGKTLFDYAQSLVCGDDAPRPKPSPATLFMACDEMQVEPKDVIYVGDAARDVEAGAAAGMKTIVALFGYLSVDDRPAEWGADYLLASAEEILPIVKENCL